MKEKLINLGAKILRIKPANPLKMILVLLVHRVITFPFVILIFLSAQLYDNCVTAIAIGTIFWIVVMALMIKNALPQAITQNTLFEVLVNDQTDINGIAEQFEVVDTSNYPILTVKSK